MYEYRAGILIAEAHRLNLFDSPRFAILRANIESAANGRGRYWGRSVWIAAVLWARDEVTELAGNHAIDDQAEGPFDLRFVDGHKGSVIAWENFAPNCRLLADLILTAGEAERLTAEETPDNPIALIELVRQVMPSVPLPKGAVEWAATEQANAMGLALLDSPDADNVAPYLLNPGDPLDLQQLQDDRPDDYDRLRWSVLAGVADQDLRAFHAGAKGKPRLKPRILQNQDVADTWCGFAGQALGTPSGRALIAEWLETLTENLTHLRALRACARARGMTWQEAQRSAESHVKAHGGACPPIKRLAAIVGCSRPTMDKAVKGSKYLSARRAESQAGKAGRIQPLTDAAIDHTEQRTEAQPDELAALIEEQQADERREERQTRAAKRRQAR